MISRKARRFVIKAILVVLVLCPACARAQVAYGKPEFIGWATNGPGIFRTYSQTVTYSNVVWKRESFDAAVTNADSITTTQRFRIVRTNTITTTNNEFAGFLPQSLNHLIWTNLIAHTNGRSTRIWSLRWHPPSWPTNAPTLMWNTNNLMWGMRGMTALSPCWQGEGASGQVPITAFTSRHGYARGHGMGPEGLNPHFNGRKVWFLTTNNTVVETKIANAIVRAYTTRKADYTIFLFADELPAGIEPMSVVSLTNVNTKYVRPSNAPYPFFLTEQYGHVSGGLPGWTVDTWKAGDSGSPNMLPMPGELVFMGGRSTSGASAEMQEDIDELSRQAGLDPARYRLRWSDLSGFPDYTVK